MHNKPCIIINKYQINLILLLVNINTLLKKRIIKKTLVSSSSLSRFKVILILMQKLKVI